MTGEDSNRGFYDVDEERPEECVDDDRRPVEFVEDNDAGAVVVTGERVARVNLFLELDDTLA